jgi:hypothetical protein
MQTQRLTGVGVLAAVCVLAWSVHKRRKEREAWNMKPLDPEHCVENPALTPDYDYVLLDEPVSARKVPDEEMQRWMDKFFLEVSKPYSPAGREGV